MRFWAREIAGWVLVALGLYVFYLTYDALFVREPPAVLQTGPLVVMGVVLFWGGIHLLKVAVAARIALQAQEQFNPRTSSPRRPAAPARRPASPVARATPPSLTGSSRTSSRTP